MFGMKRLTQSEESLRREAEYYDKLLYCRTFNYDKFISIGTDLELEKEYPNLIGRTEFWERAETKPFFGIGSDPLFLDGSEAQRIPLKVIAGFSTEYKDQILILVKEVKARIDQYGINSDQGGLGFAPGTASYLMPASQASYYFLSFTKYRDDHLNYAHNFISERAPTFDSRKALDSCGFSEVVDQIYNKLITKYINDLKQK